MTLNTAFIHTKTSITAYITSQHMADNQFISGYLHITVINLCGENKYLSVSLVVIISSCFNNNH